MAFTARCMTLIGRTPSTLTRKIPFVARPRMAATDNDTDMNFNEKMFLSNPPSHSCRCLKTTAATSSPAPTRTTAPHPIRSTTAAPPTGPTKTTGPTATWQEPHTPTNTDWADITTLEPCYRHHPSIRVCVCGGDMNNIACLVLEVLYRIMWMQFCYQFESLLISSRNFFSSSIYLHQTALSEISKHSYWYNPLSVWPMNESIPRYGVSMLL